jgi:hypothetical protein
MLNTSKIFKNLQGNWKIWRTIPNHGEMEGIVFFKNIDAETNALHYCEEGVFTTVSGESLNTNREYVYRYEDDEISTYFVDKNAADDKPKTDRLFHTLIFSASSTTVKATAEHLCERDKYVAIYDFYNDDEFKITYQVKGPAKDYVSNTIFKRYPLTNTYESAGKDFNKI